MAIGIAGLVNVLDPDTVVLGGLFARILPSMRASLDDELALRRYRTAQRDVAVVGAALGPGRSPWAPPSWRSARCSRIRHG